MTVWKTNYWSRLLLFKCCIENPNAEAWLYTPWQLCWLYLHCPACEQTQRRAFRPGGPPSTWWVQRAGSWAAPPAECSPAAHCFRHPWPHVFLAGGSTEGTGIHEPPFADNANRRTCWVKRTNLNYCTGCTNRWTCAELADGVVCLCWLTWSRR